MQRWLSKHWITRLPRSRNSIHYQPPLCWNSAGSLATWQFQGLRDDGLSRNIRAFSSSASVIDEVELNNVGLSSTDSDENGQEEYLFREKLNNWYRVHHDVSLKDAFETHCLDGPLQAQNPLQAQQWTAAFVCPITKHRLESWRIPGCDSCQEIGGKWYYAKKKTAMHAASMNAVFWCCPESEVDESKFPGNISRAQLQLWYMKNHEVCLHDDMFHSTSRQVQGREEGGTWWTTAFSCPITGELFKAVEIPGKGPVFQDEAGRVYYRRKGDAVHAAITSALHSKEAGEAGLPQTEPEVSRSPLRQWYRERHHVDISDLDFDVDMDSWKGSGGNHWTAAFTCPISGSVYNSGTIKGEPSISDGNGKTWYRKKEDAIVAAGLRAYDAFRFKESGDAEERFCEESPLLQDQDDLGPKTTGCGESIQFYPQDDDELGGDTSDTLSDTEEEEDDYIIEFVPQRVGSSAIDGVATSTTLDLVAQAWVELSQPAGTDPTRKKSDASPEVELKQAIERASSWITQQQQQTEAETRSERTLFDDRGSINRKEIANLILSSLASAHQRIPFRRESAEVENTAKDILDFMWSSPSTAPSPDSYAAYILCMEGHNPVQVAQKAQKLFDAMQTGKEYEGRHLPRPNTTVLNSLLQRVAEAGIKTSLADIEDGFETDRATYIACLSSVAHATGGRRSVFDTAYALDCIDRMRTLSESRGDPTLRPDMAVFNAPLRWSGGSLSQESRPFSRCIKWDSYNELFGEGRAWDESDAAVQEAQAMENWLQSIRKNAFGSEIRPSIDTYESVIQAWVRTGTLEGLAKAESLVEELLSNQTEELMVRHQTFHPIIAGWAYSGNQQSPSRVDHWIHRVESLLPEPSLSSPFRAVRILSRTAVKGSLYPAHAHQCSLILDASISDCDGSENESLLEADAFSMTIEAWYKLGAHSAQQGLVSDFENAAAAIRQAVESFDSLVAALGSSDDEFKVKQRSNLVAGAPRVYSTAVTALRDMGKAAGADSVRTNPLFAQNLDWLEQRVMWSEEHCLQAGEVRGRADANKYTNNGEERSIDNDLFTYDFETIVHSPPANSWVEFYGLVVRTIRENLSQHSTPDLVRLCGLISRTMQDGHDGTSSLESEEVHDMIVNILESLGVEDTATVTNGSRGVGMGHPGGTLTPEVASRNQQDESRHKMSRPRYHGGTDAKRRKRRRDRDRDSQPSSRRSGKPRRSHRKQRHANA